MNLGALEVQIFVSLALVLGSVFVALVCDFLKGNNEVLRERNIELRVRQEERERVQTARVPLVTRVARRAVRTATSPGTLAPETVKPSQPPQKEPVRTEVEQPAARTAWARPEELKEVDDLAKRIRSRLQSRADIAAPEPPAAEAPSAPRKQPEPEPAPIEVKAPDIPAQPKPVVPRPEAPRPEPSFATNKVTPINAALLDRSSAEEAIQLAEELARVASFTAGDLVEAGSEVEGALADVPTEEPAPETEAEPVAEPDEHVEMPAAEEAAKSPADPSETTPQQEKVSLPAGMLDQATFDELLQSRHAFRGTVVTVGVGGLENAPWEERPAAELIQSLLGEDDLGCRTREGEFTLVFPEEKGSEGQRRVQYISQRLWDHQIRSVSRSPIMFSWGATEASEETLAAAVASARERLDQTRRNRERAPHRIHQYRVVNR